ncbi:MAG: twin-arginine translocase TatA/TatE family subunit [Candidatus Omnitrophota bacterium]
MFGSIGVPELILIFVVVLFLFGPNKLPDFAKTFGKALREFRKTVNEAKSAIEEEIQKSDVTGDIKEDLKEIDQDIKKIARMEIEDDTQSPK